MSENISKEVDISTPTFEIIEDQLNSSLKNEQAQAVLSSLHPSNMEKTWILIRREIEIRNWISQIVESPLNEEEDLCTLLQDGVILCKLMRAIQPESIPKINIFPESKNFDKSHRKLWKWKENIFFFIAGAQDYGIQKHLCFEVMDLFDHNRPPNLSAVITTLEHLKILYYKKSNQKQLSSPVIQVISHEEEEPTPAPSSSPPQSPKESPSPLEVVPEKVSPPPSPRRLSSPDPMGLNDPSPPISPFSSISSNSLSSSQSSLSTLSLDGAISPSRRSQNLSPTSSKPKKQSLRTSSQHGRKKRDSGLLRGSTEQPSGSQTPKKAIINWKEGEDEKKLEKELEKLLVCWPSSMDGFAEVAIDPITGKPKRPSLRAAFSFKRLISVRDNVVYKSGLRNTTTASSMSRMSVEEATILFQSMWRRNRAQMLFFQRLRSQAYRDRVAHEVLSTETTYVKNLEILLQVYLLPLQSSYSEQLRSIISNVQMILHINSEFHEKIRERVDNWSPHQCIGDIFLSQVPLMKVYTQYVKDYENTITTIISLKSQDSSFAEHLETSTSTKADGKDISSFLITPIQRIPRYELLLKELIKNTWEEHRDYLNLTIAYQEIKKVARYVDERKRQAENISKMIEIQTSMSECVNIAAPHRRFVFQGILSICEDIMSRERICFLFNDSLVISKAIVSKEVLNNSLFRPSPQNIYSKKRDPLLKFKNIIYFKPYYTLSLAPQKQTFIISNEKGESVLEGRPQTTTEYEQWKTQINDVLVELQNSHEKKLFTRKTDDMDISITSSMNQEPPRNRTGSNVSSATTAAASPRITLRHVMKRFSDK